MDRKARSTEPMNPAVATPTECCPAPPSRRWLRLRPWVQAGFLGVWLAPLGRWLHGIPGCVFHCYACPWSSFGCPVGLLANYAAMAPVWATVPWLLIGVLAVVGATTGSLACGWSCPFGYLQDLLGKLRHPKWSLPGWSAHLRYVVLVGLVLGLPYVWGRQGVLYEDQAISICRLCPAGALEAGLPYAVQSVATGGAWTMSWYKTAILGAFLVGAVMIHRPWCRLFCPLGGLLALFNRVSLFHLRFNPSGCSECSLCRTRCPVGVKLDLDANARECVRCLECTRCGAITPAMAWPERRGGKEMQAR
jgi:ferredoxin-type protein NapH